MNKRNTQKVLRVIETALATLRNKKNWISGASAATIDSEYTMPGRPDAVKFCATGAIRHFTLNQASASDPRDVVSFIERSAIEEVYRSLKQVSHRDVESVVKVNDSMRQDAHRRIVRAFRVARNNLRKQLSVSK